VVETVAKKIRVNWIYAIAIFTSWKNAITKARLGDMPL
jgi:hypothetical protein